MKIEIEAAPYTVAIVLIAAAVCVGVWAYVARYPALAPRRRWILLGARLLTLSALLIASLAPLVRYPEASRARNRLLVLVDHSGSMGVRDASAGRSRRSVADSAASAIARALDGRYDVRTAGFDAALGPFGRDARAALEVYPGGGETALGDAIRHALERVDPDSVAALLVLSDGGVNRGEDPDRALGVAIPAFALTVGSTADPPTVGIAGVEAPTEMILGQPTPWIVTVRQGERPSSRGVVRASEDGKELGRANFTLAGPGASTRVPIHVTVNARGKRFIDVEILDVVGDPMRENKHRLVAVDARPAKRPLPLLAASWDWDLRSLSRGIEEDTTWSVARLVPVGTSQVAGLGGSPTPFGGILEDAGAAIVRYDATTITPDRGAALMRYLNAGGGVLLWIDPNTRQPGDGPLTRALGLAWRFWGQPPGAVATIELAPAGRTHEIALLGGDASSAAATWKDLPPIEPIVALGVSRSPLRPLLLGRVGSATVPILLAGTVGKGRVALLNAAGVYRWGLTASGIAGRAGVEAAFFGGIRSWLAGGVEERAVRIAAPDITPEGRPVAVRITTALPGDGEGREARVIAWPQGAQGTQRGSPGVETALSPAPGGEFSGSIPLAPGTYVLRGRVVRAGQTVGSDSIRVAVGIQGVEYEALAAEPDLLKRMAEGSGGLVAPLDSSEQVMGRLRSPGLARTRLAEMDLFNNPLLFTLLIVALALEWALRRRFHLM